jgi:hemolysin activation/secretion protein
MAAARVCVGLAWAVFLAGPPAFADEPRPSTATPGRTRTLDINEYRVEGSTRLSQLEMETVVAPYLGPGRSLDDVEKARAAIEKAYSDRGFQTVSVAIPPQSVRNGVVLLKVTEGVVGRLRVHGARWFAPSDIRQQAPSLAEGAVPNFNEIVRDIYALNQLSDRRVTPALRAGIIPGTIDVDLNVQDKLPLHGSLEWNNRASPNTTASRLDASLRYDNLFQAGHSLSLSFQIAPQQPNDAEVFAASYVWRFPEEQWLSFSFNAVLQNSDISTLGSTAVQGRGRIFGARANFTLPGDASFFQTISAGFDYKHFGKELLSDTNAAPIGYWPATAQYSAMLSSDSSQTTLSLAAVANIRGLSISEAQFDAKRYLASGNFIYFRSDLSRTQDIGRVAQVFGRIASQLTTGPLIPSEQITAGGAESVRGYLEATAAGDYGAYGTFELRTPSLAFASWVQDLRLLGFVDGGRLALRDRLPEQNWLFILWSTGGGLRLKAFDRLVGALDLGVPLRSAGTTTQYHPRLQFRLAWEF